MEEYRAETLGELKKAIEEMISQVGEETPIYWEERRTGYCFDDLLVLRINEEDENHECFVSISKE